MTPPIHPPRPAGHPGYPATAAAPVVLTEKDYRPIDGYPFQRWGERGGRPFRDIRPLAPDAARRAWRQALQLNGAEWDGSLPPDTFPRESRLDLRTEAWDESSVRDWLLGRGDEPDERVLACYGPEWAIEVRWGTFCEFWLTFLWVDACAWPAAGPAAEGWFLRYAGEQLTFGHRVSA